MYHTKRWTLDKIRQRLELTISLAYIKTVPLPPFRFKELDNPLAAPPVAPGLDGAHWAVLNPNDYWGTWMSDFILRTSFTVPDDWERSAPIALYLPLGVSGDFSHPEALAYVDGSPYAACDCHHQEILLRPEWADGKAHALALHAWTGIGGLEHGDFFTKLYMRQCSVVQIHQLTRDYIALARTARETAENLEEGAPASHGLLNALNEAFNVLETRDPLGAAFYAYTAEALTAAWQTVCLNQFHDIVTGASIGPVNEESLAQYAQLADSTTRERDAALAALSASFGGNLLLVNPSPFSRSDLAFIPGELTGDLTLDGRLLTVQPIDGSVLVDPGELPEYSVTPVAINHSQSTPVPEPGT